MDFSNLQVIRFTIHKLFSKKDLKNQRNHEPHAEPCNELCNLNQGGLDTLKNRIIIATSHGKRFFELDLADTGYDSFWHSARGIFGSMRKQFIATANIIADKAAAAHDRGNIPGGLLLVVECNLAEKNCLAVIKAERSKAFSLSGSNIELIEDLFLSTDKTLYKIGFLVKVGVSDTSPSAYKCYVYDDSFSAIKEDLAYYFYHNFLGFSTENNSKIQTNNFYKFTTSFIERFIRGFGDQNAIMRTIDIDMLSKKKKIIHPNDYKSLFPDELHEEFDRNVSDNLPRAIPKDISVLPDIESKRIKINEDAILLAKNGIGNQIVVLDDLNEKNLNSIKRLFIDTGKNGKIVFIPQAEN